MQKSIFGFLAILFLGLTLVSCKKEQTFDDKLVGTWSSTKVIYDNSDATSLFQYTIVFQPSKEFELTQKTPLSSQSIIRSGTWETNEARQEVILRYDDSTESTRYDINALDGSHMTAETLLDGKKLEIELKK